jgi:hypothetical protein
MIAFSSANTKTGLTHIERENFFLLCHNASHT